jgi:hypothetical protein
MQNHCNVGIKLCMPAAISVQEPLSPIFKRSPGQHAIIGEADEPERYYWSHVGSHAIIGHADGPGRLSLAVTKARVSHFEAQYDVPATKPWQLGTVLGYQDAENFTLLLISSDGMLRTLTNFKKAGSSSRDPSRGRRAPTPTAPPSSPSSSGRGALPRLLPAPIAFDAPA